MIYLLPSAESRATTEAFLERVGGPIDVSVIVHSNLGANEVVFTFPETSGISAGESPWVHIAVVDDSSGDVVAVRSVPQAIVDLDANTQ